MTINVPSEIGAVLAELAAKLGVAAEALWAVVLRQQTVCGFGYLAAAVVAGVAAICLCRLAYLHGSHCYPFDAGGLGYVAVVAVLSTGGLAWLAAMRFLNPAFYALNYLLGLLR